jgi:hypothetical protein
VQLLLLWTHTRSRMPAAVSGISLMPTYARRQIVAEDRVGVYRCIARYWVETVRGFGRLFKQAAGRSGSLVDAAARCSRRWFQGRAAARTAFP